MVSTCCSTMVIDGREWLLSNSDRGILMILKRTKLAAVMLLVCSKCFALAADRCNLSSQVPTARVLFFQRPRLSFQLLNAKLRITRIGLVLRVQNNALHLPYITKNDLKQ